MEKEQVANYVLRLVPSDAPTRAEIRWNDGRAASVPLGAMASEFFDWQVKTRIANLTFFSTGQGPHDFAVHTGYMATRGEGRIVPVNAAAKGIGLLPLREIEALTEEIERLIALQGERGEEATRQDRLAWLLRLYREVPLDNRVLSTIEIYGKQTWQNVHQEPRCCVLFSSYRSTSFAINGVVEVVRAGHPVYRYVVAVHDLFHPPRGPRPAYPAVYRIWAAETWDKSPGPTAGARIG